MSNIIDSFLVALGFEVEDSGAKEYQAELEKVTLSLTAVVAAAAAAAAAIGLFVAEVAGGMDDLGDFADQENYSAAALVELGHAAQLSGSSLEAVKSSLSGVNRVIGEAALGIGRGAMTFQKLHMQAKNADGSVKNFDQIIDEVSKKMQGLSRQESIALAEKLGFDRSLVPLLLKGADAIAQLREEARAFGAATDEDFEVAGKFADSMDRTKFVLKSLSETIAVQLMPSVGRFIDGLRNWLVQNKEIIKTNLGTFLRVVSVLIGTMFEYVMRLVSGITSLVSWLSKFTVVTVGATVAMAALLSLQVYRWSQDAVRGLISMARWLFTIDFLALLIPAAIGAIILAVALLIDEFINFKEGNDSFLGDLVKDYPQLLGVINSIADGVAAVIDWFSGLWKQVGPSLMQLGNSLLNLFVALWPVIKLVGTVIGAVFSFALPIVIAFANGLVQAITFAVQVIVLVISGLITAFSVVVDAIAASINFLVSLFTGAADGIKAAFMAVFDWLVSKFDSVVDKVKSALGWLGNFIGAADDATNGAMSNSAQSPSYGETVASMDTPFQATGGLGVAAQPNTGSVTNQTTNQTTVGDITVVSPDPAMAGQNVKDALTEQSRQSIRNGQSAVAI